MLQGLSRFLVQHERCGAGFDVAHPAGLGSGRVSITCRGCGARHEYATATIEVERELKIEPAEGRGQPQPPAPPPAPPAQVPSPPAPIPPRPAPYPDTTRQQAPATPPASARHRGGHSVSHRCGSPGRPALRGRAAAPPAGDGTGQACDAPARRRRDRRSEPCGASGARRGLPWRSSSWPRLRSGLRSCGWSTTAAARPPRPPPPPPPSPTPRRAAATADADAGAPGSAGGPVPAPSQPATTTLRTRNFTLQAPAGWTDRTSTGGLLLEPRGGGRVNVQVYFQRSPGLSRDQMAQPDGSLPAPRGTGRQPLPNGRSGSAACRPTRSQPEAPARPRLRSTSFAVPTATCCCEGSSPGPRRK